jgi:hypothetical protein
LSIVVGRSLARVAQGDQRRNDLARRDELPPAERAALRKIRIEAKHAGSQLTTGGKGGGSPSFVLGIFRRDKFRCKTCGELGNEKNGGIGLHHKGGIPSSAHLSRLGHKWTRSNVVTICNSCHDREHEEARANGEDSSQVTPEGDVGTRRDHGKPSAEPES